MPAFATPRLSSAAVVGIPIPLFIITMASQNIAGIAVLSSFGFRPDASAMFTWTGAFSLVAARSAATPSTWRRSAQTRTQTRTHTRTGAGPALLVRRRRRCRVCRLRPHRGHGGLVHQRLASAPDRSGRRPRASRGAGDIGRGGDVAGEGSGSCCHHAARDRIGGDLTSESAGRSGGWWPAGQSVCGSIVATGRSSAWSRDPVVEREGNRATARIAAAGELRACTGAPGSGCRRAVRGLAARTVGSRGSIPALAGEPSSSTIPACRSSVSPQRAFGGADLTERRGLGATGDTTRLCYPRAGRGCNSERIWPSKTAASYSAGISKNRILAFLTASRFTASRMNALFW